MKFLIIFTMVIGSGIGSYVPTLWGAGMFSLFPVLFSAVGGIVGIYIGFKLGQSWGLD